MSRTMGQMINREKITRPLGHNLTDNFGLIILPDQLVMGSRYPVKTATDHQIIVSASDNRLTLEKNGLHIGFSITRDSYHSNLARLGLYSETANGPDVDFKGHASDFLEKSIRYLNQFSWPFTLIGIIADWRVDERNHREFWNNIGSGATIEEAASNTWTGEKARNLGFKHVIQIPHVTLNEDRPTALIFSRKNSL